MEGQGEGLWGLGSLYHQACPEAPADSLGMTSCPERTRSAWLDPGAGSRVGKNPSLTPGWELGHLPALPREGLA